MITLNAGSLCLDEVYEKSIEVLLTVSMIMLANAIIIVHIIPKEIKPPVKVLYSGYCSYLSI